MNSMLYGQLFPNASDIELESLRRLGARWKVGYGVFPGEAFFNFFFFNSNTRKKANGSMSNILSGALVTPSGIYTRKLPICSFTSLVRIWLFLRAILITGNWLTIVLLPRVPHSKLRLVPWRVLQALL